MGRIFVKGGVWRNSEDEILKAAVMKYGLNNWSRVASLLVKKSAKQCKARWYEWLDPSVKKTEWTTAEEEKLLHLAKIFPSQWKTIAPVVGRTAHQCLMHYEELLDQAQEAQQEGDTGQDETTGKSYRGPGRGIGFLRGRDDPRRLRPGEIDPQPETKPSRADPIDMADEEKEMLEEARARLANTRGKKAKRKAREKQLEEARRLASLQKKRELKAAGILNNKRRNRRYFNNFEEIPFEEKPSQGFYEVPASENPEGNLNFANISLQQLEGQSRAKEEERMRREDLRKLKRLKEDKLDEYLKQQEEKMNRQTLSKKAKLNLPEPVLKDEELEELVRLGTNASILGSQGNNSLLPGGGESSIGITGDQSSVMSRTPMKGDRIAMEIKNALALTGQITPLEGGENIDVVDLKTLTPLNFGEIRTPNYLQSQLSKSKGLGYDTPLLSHNSSKMGIGTPGGQTEDGGGAGLAAKIQLAQLAVKTGMKNLPGPQNIIEPQMPDEDLYNDEKKAHCIEDASEVEAKKAAAAASAAREQQLLQSLVLQENLPRPMLLQTQKPLHQQRHANVVTSVSAVYGVKGEAQKILLKLFQESGKMVDECMRALVTNDIYNYPFKGIKPPLPSGPVPEVTLKELEMSRELINKEYQSMEPNIEDSYKISKILGNFYLNSILNPVSKKLVSVDSLSGAEKVEVYRHQHGVYRQHLSAAVTKIKKLEKKYKILTSGYLVKQKDLVASIEAHASDLIESQHKIDSFTRMRSLEKLWIKKRLDEKNRLLLIERNKHLFLQQQYGHLQGIKKRLLERFEKEAVKPAPLA